MFPSWVGSVLVLHTVQAEVHREQVLYAPQPRGYHDMSPLGCDLLLQQPVVTAPRFSQVGSPAPATMGWSSFHNFFAYYVSSSVGNKLHDISCGVVIPPPPLP